MASRIHIRTKFIPQLLAPLPADEEQPDDKRFLRQLQKDAVNSWRLLMRQVQVAKARRDLISLERGDQREAFRAYVTEVDRQMSVPAPDRAALKWKRQHILVGAATSDIRRREAFIAADVARLGAKA